MLKQIREKLAPVCRRQKLLLSIRLASCGLLVSSVAALGLGLCQWLGSPLVPNFVSWAILAAGPVVGGVIGMIQVKNWSAAARAVDDHFHLHDRTITAMDFLKRGLRSGLHAFQIEDAVEHLAEIDPRQAVPLRIPSLAYFAILLAIPAAVIVAWPVSTKTKETTQTKPEAVETTKKHPASDVKAPAKEDVTWQRAEMVEEKNHGLSDDAGFASSHESSQAGISQEGTLRLGRRHTIRQYFERNFSQGTAVRKTP